MARWTMKIRSRVERTPSGLIRSGSEDEPPGLVSLDLAFVDGPELTLRLADVEQLEIALDNALHSINDDLPNRFKCIAVRSGFVLMLNGFGNVLLSRDEAEVLRADLKGKRL